MADNLFYTNPATGSVIATDNITIAGSSVHAQRVKLALGTDGEYQDDLKLGATIAASSVPVSLPTDQTYPFKMHSGGKATYMSSSRIPTTIGINVGNIDSIGQLWHSSGATKKAILQKALISWIGNGSGNGAFAIKVTRMFSQPGGSGEYTVKQDDSDIDAESYFVTLAPSGTIRGSGDVISLLFHANLDGQIELVDTLEGKGLTLRSGVSQGWDIRTEITEAVTFAPPKIAVSVTWTEEA